MKSYRSFLISLGSEMLEALRECENLEYHHKGEATPEFQHYLRLATWLDELATRLAYYDDVKAKKRPEVRVRTTAKDVVDRHLSLRADSERDARQHRLDGDAQSVLEAWTDLGKDDSKPVDSA